MMDYRAIEVHIQHARLERSALLGELTKVTATLQELAKPPKEYSTALPRQR